MDSDRNYLKWKEHNDIVIRHNKYVEYNTDYRQKYFKLFHNKDYPLLRKVEVYDYNPKYNYNTEEYEYEFDYLKYATNLMIEENKYYQSHISKINNFVKKW